MFGDFMGFIDGATSSTDRILVLVATNRPTSTQLSFVGC